MIKFVYFDIGGTIVRDFSGTDKWNDLKRDMGVKPKDYDRFTQFFLPLEVKVNCGQSDIDDLFPLIAKEFNLVIPPQYSFLEDFVSRFTPNPSIWPVIEKIKKHYRVGLLTNMYPRMFNMIREKDLLPSVSWDVIIDSSLEGVQKPEKEIYEIAQKKCGAKKDEIFFIDNVAVNIETAKSFSWQTFLYNPNNVEKSNHDLMLLFKDNEK